MIDITDWLVIHDRELVSTDMYSSPQSMRLFHEAWDELFFEPYVNPSNEFLNYISRNLKDPRSSSDTLAHLIKSIRDHISRIISRQQTLKEDETFITDPFIKTLKQKAEQLIRVTMENLEEARISHIIRRALSELVVEILAIYDPDPFSGLHDACRSLQYITTHSEKEDSMFDEPPKLELEAELSPLMQLLNKKRNQEQKTKIFKSSDDLLENDNVSEMSIGQIEQAMTIDLKDNDVLLFDKMYNWIEVDPDLNRLVETKTPDAQGPGILCSEYSGKFQMTTSKFLWYGIPKELKERAVELQENCVWDLAICIPFHTIQCFLVQSISISEDVRKSLSSSQGEGGIPVTDITRQYFISFYTKTEVYKFFPFTSPEVQFIKDALDQLAHLRPVYQDHYIRKILSDKLFYERRSLLEQLIKQGKWLESSVEIQKCISNLTIEDRPTDQKEMELLFHSCRLESAVTNETVVLLQQFWAETTSDTVKFSLLKIVDRLLDPLVMQRTDPVFFLLHSWLRQTEPQVNPYKRYFCLISPILCAQISRLVRRCKNIVHQQMNPLVQSHTKSQFEHWDEFSQWLRLYNVSTLEVESQKE